MSQRAENNELFEVVKKFHEKENFEGVPVQHPFLIPKLRPYQEKAVQWMIFRETPPLIQIKKLELVEADDASSNSINCSLPVTNIPTGGILSDEMGLGKTVEVLACILSNPRIDIEIPKPNHCEEEEEEDTYEHQFLIKERDALKKERGLRAKRRNQEKESESNTETSSVKLTGRQSEPHDQLDGAIKMKGRRRKAQDEDEDWEVSPKKKGRTNKKSMKEKKPQDHNEDMVPGQIKKGPSLVRQSAQQWYESKLSEVNKNPLRSLHEFMEEGSRSRYNIQCICGETDEKNLISCGKCSRWLHKACIGAQKWEQVKPVYCPQCWLKQTPIQSRATLIVSPTSISGQWMDEVNKHISKKANFKVLSYKGVGVNGFLQPYEFADYDLILTTYCVLRRELYLAEVHEGRSSRYEKRYFSPTCPLLCVDFWRICLDEAQMVEGHASKAADMVSRFTSVHRWAVTGTPIQKSLQDLYGLVMFLCIEPYWEVAAWKNTLFDPYCTGDKYPLYTLLAHIMWRSSKADVLDQIQIPPQTELLWWHSFSPVEEHFYMRTHQECSNDFLERLSKFDSLHQTLQSLKIATVNHVLGPLLKLRQACSHPQAVRGNVLATQKNTMTMTELLESLIKKTTIEAQEALRKHISSLNAMAGLYIIHCEYVSAAEKYREVLRIAEEYKERIKVDTLQRIHTMHNLDEMIKSHRDIIPPTLRDDTLLDEAKKLQESYLSKAQIAVSSVEESLVDLSATVSQHESIITEGESSWWTDLCYCLDREEVLSRVHDALVNHRKSMPDITSTSIINRVSTMNGLQATCCQWLENLEKNQSKVRKSLKALKGVNNETLVNEAVDCHLRISNLKSKTQKALCQLCVCENILKKYEMDLFDIKLKKNENIMVGDVLLLGQGKEGSWKPSEQETVLKTILSLGKHKKADKELIKSGSKFFNLMNSLRKEFKPLRLLWSRINERTCAQDELNMCKLRLRLRYPDEPSPSNTSAHVSRRKKVEKNKLSSNLDTKMENLHVIEPHQVEALAQQNNLEAIAALSELRKKSGTVAYLQNLRTKDGTKSSAELCPVCRSNLEKKWAVLICGHCYCMDCVTELYRKKKVMCAVCRETTTFEEVSFVNPGCDDEDGQGSETTNVSIPSVQGSHSTKVEAIIKRLFYLRADDPDVKVLIFSTWDRVLEVLEEALTQNGIEHLRLKPGPKYELTLKKFKNLEDGNSVTALLMPLKLGSKGLNLTEATHVMMVEPVLNPAEELQAIGRVHRIGQTRPTFIHRFLIKDTIEERMFSAVQATGKEQWSGKQVTLQQLKELFSTSPPTSCAAVANASQDDEQSHEINESIII